MSEILANQWRPQSFETVVGQSNTVTALTNALDQSLLHHCYLFSGTRGVGKTSLARLFAQGLNCTQGISANPCGKCDSCLGIKRGEDLDCYEIDAASRTKVEETLKILDMANYPPTRSKFKIFLIDEVHMLSNHSFNALLKTLEQPPSYVKFLLATTEPQRIPDTVRSRCIQFKLQPVSGDILGEHLKKVVTSANKSITKEALNLLVQAANGSVRDAMTALQHILLQSTDSQIELSLVENSLGLVPGLALDELLTIIQNSDSDAALAWCNKLAKSQLSWSKLLDQWLLYLNQMLWKKKDHQADPNLQNWIQIALLAKKDLPFYPISRMAFEVMVARTIHCIPNKPTQWLDEEVVVNLEKKSVKQHNIAHSVPDLPKKPVDQASITSNPTIKTQPEVINHTNEIQVEKMVFSQSNWPLIAEKMKLTGMVNQLLQHLTFESFENNVVSFFVVPDKASLLNDKARQTMQTRLQALGYDHIKIDIAVSSDSKNQNIDQIKKEVQKNVKQSRQDKLEGNEDFKRIRQSLNAELID